MDIISSNFRFSERALNTIISFFLFFQAGALYSLGLFNSSASSFSPPSHPLNSAWSSAMSYMSLLISFSMICTGFFLSSSFRYSRVLPMSSRLQLLIFLAALIFSVLSRSGYVVENGDIRGIDEVIGIQGVGMAIRKLNT